MRARDFAKTVPRDLLSELNLQKKAHAHTTTTTTNTRQNSERF